MGIHMVTEDILWFRVEGPQAIGIMENHMQTQTEE